MKTTAAWGALEIALLSAAMAYLQSPTVTGYLATHRAIADLVMALYTGWRTWDRISGLPRNPTSAGEPGKE